jgi:autotransporter-associated beta strand protein
VNNTTGYQNLQGIWGRANADTGLRGASATSWQLGSDQNDFLFGGEIFINGVAGNTFTPNVPHLISGVSGLLRGGWATAIGDYWGNANNRRSYFGDIGEILVYDRWLSTADRQTVEAYLQNKWFGSSPVVPTDVLPASTALIVSGGAALDLNGISQAVGSLSGAGSVFNSGADWATLTVGGNGADTVFSGVVSGSNRLDKVGDGTLTLGGDSTYLGGTRVGAGTLKLAGGSLPAGGTVTVAADAVLDLNGQAQTVAGLDGSGTVVGGNLTVAGVIAPGGVGTVGKLSILGTPALSGTLLVDTRASGDCDVLSVDGDLNLSALALRLDPTATGGGRGVYTIATCTGELTGTFASHDLPSAWSIRYVRVPGGGRVDLVLKFGTLLLLR